MNDRELGPKRPDEFRIAHLSDLHINADRSELRHRLRSWARQSHAHNLSNFQSVMRDIAQREIDHIVITGDLTTNAREDEIAAFKQCLGEYIDPDRLTIVPGNHDICYRRAARRAVANGFPRKLNMLLAHFGDLFPTAYPPQLGLEKKRLFPFVKMLHDERIVLIGIDTTGRLTKKAGPLNSFGTISRAQLRELRTLLKSPWLQERLKIVAMHHHPVIVPVATIFDSFKQLFQSKQLLDLLYECRVDLIMHGHKHQPFCWQSHTFNSHDIMVICAGPPDAYANGRRSDLVYNIYSIVGHAIKVHYQTCPPTGRPKTQFTFRG